MREEIQLLFEWLEAPGEIEVEFDPLVDAILDEPLVIEEHDEQETCVCTDTTDDLVEAFLHTSRPHKRRFIWNLFQSRENWFFPNGKPKWVDARDVPDFFGVRAVPNKSISYPAWALSNHRGSDQYFGEWLIRKGTRQRDGKFRTTQYQIRKEAISAFKRIFRGEATHDDCNRQIAFDSH